MLKQQVYTITIQELVQHQDDLLQYDHFRFCSGSLIALCLQDPVDTIGAFRFLKDQHASILLLHGELPYESAIEAATRAGCTGLIYATPNQYIELQHTNRDETHAITNRSLTKPSLLMFSSGTTGAAKLIQRPLYDLELEIEAYNKRLEQVGAAELVPIVLAPVSHAYGLISGVLSALDRGQSPLVVTGRNPKKVLGLLEQVPNHLIYGVPVLLSALEQLRPRGLSFHTLMSSGMLMPDALLHKLRSCSHKVMQQYGCSEAGCISITDELTTPGDLGIVLSHLIMEAGSIEAPSEIIITDRMGKRIPTGDLGYRRADGHLIFQSRLDDVINVSGLKVFPAEVEAVLTRFPGVEEAVVYRGRHPIVGEVVHAMVRPEGEMNLEELWGWCRSQLSPYQVPSAIHITDQIPKGPTGKISRRQLEKEETVQ